MKFFKKDKFYKINDEFIKLSKIYRMSKLNIHTGDRYKEYLQGFINGKEYKKGICVSCYKPEYRSRVIEEDKFYQEYTALWQAFLAYNNLNESEVDDE